MGTYTWSRESRWWKNLCTNQLDSEENDVGIGCPICVEPVEILIDQTVFLNDISTVSGGPRDIRSYGSLGVSVPRIFADSAPGTDYHHLAMRFEGLNVAKDTVLTESKVIFIATQSITAATVPVRVYGELTLSGTASELPTGNSLINWGSFTKTTAFGTVSLNQTAASLQWEADVTSVINELVAQANWSTGNAVNLLFEMQQATNADFDSNITHDTTTIPKLTLTE
jgi:hypothetical protein